jgi:hypothetical protein
MDSSTSCQVTEVKPREWWSLGRLSIPMRPMR